MESSPEVSPTKDEPKTYEVDGEQDFLPHGMRDASESHDSSRA